MTNKIAKLLIIAGSDPSGGAGIQADIKAASANKVYASAVITSLTAQNTVGVSAIFNPPREFLRAQLDAVFDDIEFDAIKIGMLATKEIIEEIADILELRAKKIPLILDTVMVATSGDLLLEQNAVEALKSRLITRAFLVTPNIDEAEILAQMKIKTVEDMKIAALEIKKMGCKNVLIKGGHLQNADKKIKNILLADNNRFYIIENDRLAISKIHGTGCSLASAIAANIAKEQEIVKAIKNANKYVFKAIKQNLTVGKGSRVLKHF